MSTKVRRTLTLDANVVEMFEEADAHNLSGAINAVLQAEYARREQQAALAAFVDELVKEYGEPDPAEVEKFRALLA